MASTSRRPSDVEALPRNAVNHAMGNSAFSFGGDSSGFRSRSFSPHLSASYTADDNLIRHQTAQLAGMAIEEDGPDLDTDTSSHFSCTSLSPVRQPNEPASISLLAQRAQFNTSAPAPHPIASDAVPRSKSAFPPQYGLLDDDGPGMDRRRSKSVFDPRLAARVPISRVRASVAAWHTRHGSTSNLHSHALGTGALTQAQEEIQAAESGVQVPGEESLMLETGASLVGRQTKVSHPTEPDERTSLLPAHGHEVEPPRPPAAATSPSPMEPDTWLDKARIQMDKALSSARTLTWSDVRTASTEPIRLLPATLLGVLMNVLDGVSYGMITFPTSYPLFSSFGGDGVSMFFGSCIVSQIVFSGGGSTFGGGNGSMMIECIPFYSMISKNIIAELDDDAAIISTVIVAFALSSIFIGLTFLLLRWLHTSKLLQFIPRHLLVGAIGGVGVFLVTTGLEVAGQLKSEEGFQWNLTTLRYFFQSTHVVALWTIPLGLSLLLRLIMHKFDAPLIFPLYFFSIPIIFYLIASLCAGYTLDGLRANQWVFGVGPAADAPFYRFYTLIDLRKISLKAFVATLPTQAALTFFGTLHVPLNIPVLAISTNEDNIDTDRELIGHGISNLAAGAFFSPPNYITYVNSLLFYRVGGGNRLSGFMLALATVGILVAGPSAVGYLPIMVVAALIFTLGLDLVKVAMYDTWGRVSTSEYLTIVVIMLVMSWGDFVAGLIVGIILACCFFVVQSSRRSAVRAVFDGSIARSTVRRHMTQQQFLDVVGTQTQVLKLQGFLFFGTINGVEQLIRRALDIAAWDENPIRFLIVDFSLVTGVDFSAAEAFVRIQRLLAAKGVQLILCGVAPDSEVGVALQSVGMWSDNATHVEVFAHLNSALEWTENEYLVQLYQSDLVVRSSGALGAVPGHSILDSSQAPLLTQPTPIPSNQVEAHPDHLASSPRKQLLHEAARTALQSHAHQPQSVVPIRSESSSKSSTDPQSSNSAERAASHHRLPRDGPAALLLTTFKGYADPSTPPSFFSTIAPYFQRITLIAGTTLWVPGDEPDGLYVIERGVLRAVFHFNATDEGFTVTENMMPGTVAGEMTFLAHQPRNAVVTAEQESVVWKLDRPALTRLIERHSENTRKTLVEILLRVSSEEQQALMGYLVSRLT